MELVEKLMQSIAQPSSLLALMEAPPQEWQARLGGSGPDGGPSGSAVPLHALAHAQPHDGESRKGLEPHALVKLLEELLRSAERACGALPMDEVRDDRS